jgi:hypothetical protein
MFKGKLAVLLVAGLLVWSSTAFAGIIDPCQSDATVIIETATGSPGTMPGCPQADGGTMAQYGFRIEIWVRDGTGAGIANVPPSDFWVNDCDPVETLILCGGSASSNADALTDATGNTQMRGTNVAASTSALGDISCDDPPLVGCTSPPPVGSPICTNGVIVIVQGETISTPEPSCLPICLPVNVRSFDITGDGVVNDSDLSSFAVGYPGGSGTPNQCIDYNADGVISLPDLSTFSLHFGPPSHRCD